MNWGEFCEAVRAEVATISGLLTEWQDAPRQAFPGVCASLAHVSQRVTASHRVQVDGAPSDPIRWELHSVTRCVIAITIESLDQDPDRAAPARLTNLRAGLWERRIPGVALADLHNVETTDVSAEEDGRIVSRFALAAVFSVDLVSSDEAWGPAEDDVVETVVVVRGRGFDGGFAVGFD